jgi:hypothetical protein
MSGNVLDHLVYPFLDEADVSGQPFAMAGNFEGFGDISRWSGGKDES